MKTLVAAFTTFLVLAPMALSLAISEPARLSQLHRTQAKVLSLTVTQRDPEMPAESRPLFDGGIVHIDVDGHRRFLSSMAFAQSLNAIAQAIESAPDEPFVIASNRPRWALWGNEVAYSVERRGVELLQVADVVAVFSKRQQTMVIGWIVQIVALAFLLRRIVAW